MRLSCLYTSSQNGTAERIVRTLNDCVRSLLVHAGMPYTYWGEALSTATHLLNRRPCRASGQATPFQLLLGTPPSYHHLHVFGCLCYPNQRLFNISSVRALHLVFSSVTLLITEVIGVWISKPVELSPLTTLYLMKLASRFSLKLVRQ